MLFGGIIILRTEIKMNIITKFFHEMFNSHCSHCREELESSNICDSCEVLSQQLALSNAERQRLLDKLLTTPETVQQTEQASVKLPISIPWAVRRQMLEREDREQAKLMKSPLAPSKSIEALEKELSIGQETGG